MIEEKRYKNPKVIVHRLTFPAVEHKKQNKTTTRKHLQSMRERCKHTHTQTRAHTGGDTHIIYIHIQKQIHPQGEIHTRRHTRTEPTHPRAYAEVESDTPSPVPPSRGLCTDPDEHNSAQPASIFYGEHRSAGGILSSRSPSCSRGCPHSHFLEHSSESFHLVWP